MDAFLHSLGWVHFWVIFATIMLIVEVFTTGFWALPFSVAAYVTALFAGLEAPFYIQLGIFVFGSAVCVFSMQWAYRKYIKKSKDDELKTGVDRLIGQTAWVVKPIKGEFQRGEVKVGGEIWSAIGANDEELAEGGKVVVRKVDGAKLVVSLPEENEGLS